MKLRVLLVGCGRFGRNHLRVLKQLEDEGKIELKGVITATEESRQKVAEEYKVETFPELTEELLESVDAVDITTPAATHFSIIKKCIPHVHILSEKPLVLSMDEMKEIKKLSQEHSRIVMVGHIFRFNNAVRELKNIAAENMDRLQHIVGKFIGKGVPEKDCGAVASILHLFDALEYILGKNPNSVNCGAKVLQGEFEDYAFITLNYGEKYSAELELGWVGEKKERSLLFRFDDMEVYCDMLKQEIEIRKGDNREKSEHYKEEPLRMEIEHFLDIIGDSKESFPDIDVAMKIQKVVDAAYKSNSTNTSAEVEE